MSVNGSHAPVRVLLANDAELIVQGLKALLTPFRHRIEVVATATGDPDIAGHVDDQEPDVMLIDAFGRSGAGLDAVRMVMNANPSFAVVCFTEADDLRHLFEALRLKVRGYLLKSIDTEELVDSIERVAAGETVIDSRLATAAAIAAARSSAGLDWQGAHLGLSRRESDVLQCIAHGSSTAEVAVELAVGQETVRSHLQQIYRKLGVHNRSAAVAVAWKEGFGT